MNNFMTRPLGKALTSGAVWKVGEHDVNWSGTEVARRQWANCNAGSEKGILAQGHDIVRTTTARLAGVGTGPRRQFSQISVSDTPKEVSKMTEFSDEAKVVCGAWWNVTMTDNLQFDRPWIIHPRTRKGLDELVDKGYLTSEPLNHYKDAPLCFRPTKKMKSERPAKDFWETYDEMEAFLQENNFPITDESQPKTSPNCEGKADD